MTRVLIVAHQRTKNIYFVCQSVNESALGGAEFLIKQIGNFRASKRASAEFDEAELMERLYNWTTQHKRSRDNVDDDDTWRIFTKEWSLVNSPCGVRYDLVFEAKMHPEE